MASGILAALLAVFIWGCVEAFGGFYPSRPTWVKLRMRRGRLATRRMRERFEAGAGRKSSRRLAFLLLVFLIAWVASASLLDKRWYEVVADAAPSLIVIFALLRVPGAMGAIGERMREYEKSAGEDPDAPLDDPPGPPPEDGPTELAL